MYSDVEDIEVEDTSTILARRQREDELSAKMRQLVANFDKYLEEKDRKAAEEDKQEVDSLVRSLGESAPAGEGGCAIDAACWKPPERAVAAPRCFRAFSADSLALSCLVDAEAPRCSSCEHVSDPGTWQEVLPHVEAFAQQTFVHSCAVADAFPRFLFFAMSVCDDADAVARFYRALSACRFEPPLTLGDILTVFYNWGFDENLVDYSFEANEELQRLKSKCGRGADGGAAASAPEETPGGGAADFPVSSYAVSHTLKLVLLKLPQVDVASQDEGEALAVLRTFAAALADRALAAAAGIYLRPLMYKMLDCLNIETWSDEKYLRLVKTLHIGEFSVFGQYAAVRALVDRPARDDRSALKGCVAWAILQVLHGVEPDQVRYVTRLVPDCFSALPPGPVAYAALAPGQLYLSLQMLGDCASSAARADAEDPAFYGRLLRHVYRLQQDLPQMSVMDSNIIKCQLVHLDFFWKSLTNDLLERQGRPNTLLAYMRDLLQQ